MTLKYRNVYVNKASTIVGPYEKAGPLKKYFDQCIDNLYNNEKSWEKAEEKLLHDSISVLLNKLNKQSNDIDLFISGDLLNQLTPSSRVASKLRIPFLGIYNACATIIEGMIIAASLIENNQVKNTICSTSSHNLSSEKQFRFPSEYGAPKVKTTTFTSTGGASIYLSNTKSNIRIESSTIGRVIDLNQNNPYHMGAVMAPAAADTIYRHLKNTNRNIDYYDLILTGDLGIYGKKILMNYMKEGYDIDISQNYNDCGVMLYDLKKQKQINAGGSGPVCSALVTFSFVLEKLKQKEFKKVLIVATGALFSPTSLYQKESIPAVAHAIGLEMIE